MGIGFLISIFPRPVLFVVLFSSCVFELFEERVFCLLHASCGVGVASGHLDSLECVDAESAA